MASSGASGLVTQGYWCYQCNRVVRANTRDPGGLICPFCEGGFLEEVSASARGRHIRGVPGSGREVGIFDILEAMAGAMQRMRFENLDGGPMILRGRGDEGYLGRGLGGEDSDRRVVPGTVGNFFLGPGFEQLIEQLIESDPSNYGNPPAARSAIDAMPTIRITRHHLMGAEENAVCPVCKDEFVLGSEVRQMPCNHLYHSDCILPWLAMRNSCPVCRYEMSPQVAGEAGSGQALHPAVPNNDGQRGSSSSGRSGRSGLWRFCCRRDNNGNPSNGR